MSASRSLLVGLALFTAAVYALPAEAQLSRSNAREAREARAQQAVPNYPEATRSEPGLKISSRYSRQFNQLVKAINDDDDPEKARRLADGLLAEDRLNAYERAFAAQIAGTAALEMDDLAAAKGYYRTAIEANGLDNNGHFGVMLNLAIAHLNDDEAAEAIAIMERFFAESKSKNPDHHYMLAGAYHQAEDFAKAVDALKTAIALSPSPKPEWKRLLFSSLMELDRAQEAVAVGEELLAAAPDDKRMVFALASTYLDLGQQDRAIALVESARAKGLLTESRDYQTLYSLYFNAEGKEREVIAVIEEGLAKGVLSRDLQTLNALAQAAYFSEDIPKAIAAYTEAAALDPKGDTGLNLAKVLSGEGEDVKARDAAHAALAKGVSKPGDAWMVIARSEAQLDNRAGARAALQEAAKYAETRDQANRMLQQMR